MPARWALPGYALLLAVVVTAPLLAPGYLLIRDAVSTPRSYLSDGALGLGESAPRAVPQDFAIVVLSAALDGGVLVKGLLVAALMLAGWGAGRVAAELLPEAGLPGQLVSATVAVWNPFVAERLLQGHWSLLLAYGCLPWVARSVMDLRNAGPNLGRWAGLAFWVALAGLTPTGAVLAAMVALVCLAVPGTGVRRRHGAGAVVVVSALAAVPWVAASLLGSGLASTRADGLAAFAPRAEPLLGTLGSLAGLGGIWNSEAVPASRTTGFALLGTVVLLGVVACGVPLLVRRRTGTPLLGLAVAAVLLPAALATGPGLALLRAAVETVPGLAVLRDGQKWVALAMPGYALAAAGAVLVLRRWLWPGMAALLCCVAVLAALPDLALGVGGKLRSVRYPPGWQQIADRINADPAPVAVLPAATMRRFGWAGPAPVLDPVPRWVRAEVLSTGDLLVSGQVVPGEGIRARAVQRMLESGAGPEALASAGVGWLLVEFGTPGPMGSGQTLSQLPVAYADGDVALYRVGGTAAPAPRARRIAMVVAHLVWAATLILGAVGSAVAWTRRPGQSGGRP
ncbi:MAG: hypothetical protein FGM52_01820 [Mycobacterium sp.]|nr:hypothetical protein [Mycobacterium sp.]